MEEEKKLEVVASKDLKSISDALKTSQEKIVADIVESENLADHKALVNLLNISQSKKHALRVLQLNNLLDLVTEEALRRYSKAPNAISNQELMNCMVAVTNQLEKATGLVNQVEEKPFIQINQTNINTEQHPAKKLSREQRENILNVIGQILSLKPTPQEEDIIDAEIVENK